MTTEDLGFTWNRSTIPTLRVACGHDDVIDTLSNRLSDFVWNTAALEGNSFTLPEVQTLMAGVFVGGRLGSEVRQIEDTAEAFAWLLEEIRTGSFNCDRATSDHCNGILARHEALVAGSFRTSAVSVNLGDRGAYTPPPVEELETHYEAAMAALAAIDRPDERALAYFAFGARAQLYFDGNKRTSRHIMNGMLMTAGHHGIVVPNSRRLEFNAACITLYADSDATEIMRFLASCTD